MIYLLFLLFIGLGPEGTQSFAVWEPQMVSPLDKMRGVKHWRGQFALADGPFYVEMTFDKKRLSFKAWQKCLVPSAKVPEARLEWNFNDVKAKRTTCDGAVEHVPNGQAILETYLSELPLPEEVEEFMVKWKTSHRTHWAPAHAPGSFFIYDGARTRSVRA